MARLASTWVVVREALEDRGYRVHSIRFDERLEEQVARYPETFGGSGGVT
jgi:hypothetical protein